MAPTRLRLGEPLPHQLPDAPPTDREAPKLSGTTEIPHVVPYLVLLSVSQGYSRLHVTLSTCY